MSLRSGLLRVGVEQQRTAGCELLSAIEGELCEKLPAVVYVRGFLVEYARTLELDVERVVSTYLNRYREARSTTNHEAEA